MILFLHGPDSYRSLAKLNQITARYQKAHPNNLGLKSFDFEKNNARFQDFKDAVQTKSLFQKKKLFVLKNAFGNSDFKKKFLSSQEIFLNSLHIILFRERGEVPKKDSFFVFLKKNARCQEFKPLKGKDLLVWTEQKFSQHQSQIEPRALNLLLEYVGNDLWQLSNEIKKLVSYRHSNLWQSDCHILRSDVELLVQPKTQTNIFKTIDFIASKQKSKALSSIHQHLQKGDSPFYLLSMIIFQFRNLLLIKEQMQQMQSGRLHAYTPRLAKKLGLHPFVIRKSLGLSQKFTLVELKKIYQRLAQIDLDIKSGKINPELALDLFVAEI